MPVKRSLWPKEIINRNYLINIIHQQEVRSIPPARASETAAEKRDSANLSDWQFMANSCKKCLKAGKIRSELKFKMSQRHRQSP